MLNGLDLFSGYAGITSLGLRKYVRPVAFCEIDNGPQAMLLSRMADGDIPVCPIWDDVRTLRGEFFPSGLIDIITGGSPCPDFSLAGLGAGLEGERGSLIFEILRLVGEIRPGFVFLENVPGIRKTA